MTAVLTVARASKKYCYSLRRSLWYGVKDVARELLPLAAHGAGLRPGEFWALDDVSFELRRGEALAIAGRNGAGKSTLLKVLYGLLKLDRGEVHLRGRTEALIELGTGIHPLLTGRENVRLGAALRGLSGRAAEELLERVIDFTQLAELIDAPVQSYSAGMKARLSYALAAHLQPDVLLVDEALAVGDIAFQRKCAAHMRGYLDAGGALLLVSHNPWHIQAVCERGILLQRGRIVFEGTAVETLHEMLAEAHDEVRPQSATTAGPFTIDEVRVEPPVVQTGEPLRITLGYHAEQRADVYWGFSIWTADQWVCVAGEHDMTVRTIGPGEGQLSCKIPRFPLVGGRYLLRASIVEASTRMPFALHGWQGGGTIIEVQESATLETVVKVAMRQLVTVDVDWQ